MSMATDLEQQLRNEARQSGLSVLALAKLAGLGYATTHGFLSGSRSISVGSAARLASALGLELRPVRRRKVKSKG